MQGRYALPQPVDPVALGWHQEKVNYHLRLPLLEVACPLYPYLPQVRRRYLESLGESIPHSNSSTPPSVAEYRLMALSPPGANVFWRHRRRTLLRLQRNSD